MAKLDNEEPCAGNPVSKGDPLVALKELLSGQGPPVRLLILAMVFEFTGFLMLVPVLPFFFMHELGMGAGQVGFLLSAYSCAQLFGAFVGGRISDAIGRYPVLVVVFAWAGVGSAVMAFVHNFQQVLFVRSIQGLSGGTAALCDAYVLDVVPASARPSYIGLIGSVKGVASVFGPGLSTVLLHVGVARRVIFLMSGVLALVSATMCFFCLQESLPDARRMPLWSPRPAKKEVKCEEEESEADSNGLMCIWFCRFTSAMGLGFLFSTYAFLIRDNFGWGDSQFGLVLLASGLLTGFMQLVIFPTLVAKFSAARVLGFGCVTGAISYTLMPQPVIMIHIVSLLLFVASGACVEPAFPLLIGEFAGARHLGFGNGVATSFRSLATILTPLVAGGLYEHGPSRAYYSGAACFTLAALGAVAVARCSALAMTHGYADEVLPLLGSSKKHVARDLA